VPSGDFSVVTQGVKAGTPIHNLILFGEDGGKTDTSGEGSRNILEKLIERARVFILERGIACMPLQGLQGKK
jgi:hypothetical protein